MLQLIKTIFLIACLVNAGMSVAHHRTLKRLVVFGDSLSDQGKLYKKYFRLIPKSPPYWDGRFSNGPVWTDILAANYTIVNESEGGATVVDYTRFSSALEYAVVTNLGNEISDFLGRHDFLRTDLVIILLGANDYIGDDPVHNDNVQRVVRDLADNIAYMQRKGAQQVLVFNLPDLGKTPYERIEGKEDAKSQVIATHNQLLDERLSALFSPQFVQVFDLHAHVDALLQAPDKHSLSNVLSPCLTESTTWDSGVVMEPGEQELYQALIKRPDLRVMDSTTPGEDTPLCEGFFYFDDLHPATAVHKLIAEQVDLYIRKHYSPISDTSHQAACDLKSGELTENPRHEAL